MRTWQIAPDKYFLELGQDIQTVIDSLEINVHSRRKSLATSSLKPSNVFVQLKHQPSLTVWKTLATTTQHLCWFDSGIADIPEAIDNKQEIIDAAYHRVEEINKAFRRGLMTDDDRVMLLLQQHGVKRKKNVWLKHKILRTQSLWWWPRSPW